MKGSSAPLLECGVNAGAALAYSTGSVTDLLKEGKYVSATGEAVAVTSITARTVPKILAPVEFFREPTAKAIVLQSG